MFKRLLSTLFIVIIVSHAAHAQNWLSQVNISPSTAGNSSILRLNFDSANSNISSAQASRAMSNFFSGIDALGTYRITLSRQRIGEASGSTALFAGTLIGTIATAGLGVIFLPHARYNYRLTARIDILDVDGQLVASSTKNNVYAANIYNSSRMRDSEIKKINDGFTALIRQAREELARERTNINPRLIAATRSFELQLDNLALNIPSHTRLAILPLSGPDPTENARMLSEITQYFLSSNRYFVLSRQNIDQVMNEILFQGTPFVDQNSSVQVGRFLGARVIIIGHLENVSNGRQLVVQAIDVETTQTLGMVTIRY